MVGGSLKTLDSSVDELQYKTKNWEHVNLRNINAPFKKTCYFIDKSRVSQILNDVDTQAAYKNLTLIKQWEKSCFPIKYFLNCLICLVKCHNHSKYSIITILSQLTMSKLGGECVCV